ncbi:hypothetical protein ACFL1H_06980, partial [Nanoarchaeota archaeon]
VIGILVGLIFIYEVYRQIFMKDKITKHESPTFLLALLLVLSIFLYFRINGSLQIFCLVLIILISSFIIYNVIFYKNTEFRKIRKIIKSGNLWGDLKEFITKEKDHDKKHSRYVKRKIRHVKKK